MQSNFTNVVNPYLTDVGVGLVFGLGYYVIKYLYGDKKDEKKKETSLSNNKNDQIVWEELKTIEDFNHVIKVHEDDEKLNPFEVIDKMNLQQVTPDISIYNNLLNSCYCSGNFEYADKLSDEIFDFGSPVNPDLSTFNILLKGISCRLDTIDPTRESELKNKQLSWMDKLYELMVKYGKNNSTVKPNDITINTSLDILIKSGEIDKAWELFEKMESKYSVKPDKYSYSTIIKALKYKPDADKLEKAFGIIEFLKEDTQSLANDEIIFNCLIDVCIKLGDIEKAEKLFQDMKAMKVEPSKITYAIMIKGYGQHFLLDKAFRVFEEMKIANLPPNEIIYGCLLNACVRSSNIEKVTEIYKEMKIHSLDMNIILYTTLIKAYTKVKDLKSALDVYYTMLNDEKVKPNIVIHNAILDCCVECGNTEKLSEIYNQIKDKAIQGEDEGAPQPDLITYSTVIKGHARAKDMAKVFDIYNFLKQNTEQFKMDEVIYNSILDGCAKTNNYERGMEIFDDMEKSNIPKSNVTYSILIKIYANSGRHDKALALLEEMKANMIKPGVIVYTCLIQTCLKSKKFEKAISLFENMKESGARPDHVLYNTVINGCLYNQKFDLACEYTLESFRQNIKIADDIYNTVLFKLSAHYCDLKPNVKIEYANNILKEMKNKGLSIPEEVFSKVAKMIYKLNGSKVDFDNVSVSEESVYSNNYKGNNNNNYKYKNQNYNNYGGNNEFNRGGGYSGGNGNGYKTSNKDNLKNQRKYYK